MTILQTQAIAILFSIGLVAPTFAQDFPGVVQIGDRQCAVENSDLHTDLDRRGGIPNCVRYCTVDVSEMREYKDFPGLVFSCAKFGSGPETVTPLENTGVPGLSDGGGAALAGIALLLGLGIAGGGGGSTSGTN